MDEGYIKFNSRLTRGDPPDVIYLRKLNAWRSRLYALGLVGVYENGVGFGNVSRRFLKDTFIISGSATGDQAELTPEQYVLVTGFDVDANNLTSTGRIEPSSESMTHGIIYQVLPKVNCVFHVHHQGLWDRYKNILPTSGEHVAYGTPEMALEVKRLILEHSANHAQVLIMGGHPEGVIVYGRDVEDTGQRLLKLVEALQTKV